MKRYSRLEFIAVLALTFLPAGITSAHLGGSSIERTVGNYFIDIGYDLSTLPVAPTPVSFDFGLRDASTKDVITFTHIEVIIRRNTKTVFHADLIAPQIGPPLMTYAVDDQGTYEMDVIYYDHDHELVRDTLPLGFTGSATGSGPVQEIRDFFLGILTGVFLWFAGTWIKKKIKK